MVHRPPIYIGGQFGESQPSMEALEEFRIQTSGMSAEYGRRGWWRVQLCDEIRHQRIPRLGHGTDSQRVDGRRTGSQTITTDVRDAWTGGITTPSPAAEPSVYIPKIYDGRNKTFFYVSYERYKEAYGGGGSPSVTAPLPEWWNGDLSRYLTNEQIGTDALGRPVMRGAIYNPATTRTVNGQVVRDPFVNNQIPGAMITQVAKNLGGIFTQHYNPKVT
ncbi:MAG: hypothetical protein U5J83_06075 [Bryobacterales bacterium]|nr:hypothetical protein [Bryobacterales bacterium]